MKPKTDAVEPALIGSIGARVPSARMGVAVVEGLVAAIVSGELAPGDTLPPEGPLSQQFGVSRTVIRESMKRIEEKGLVTVAQGRGTQVRPTRSWNILDRVVLAALMAHDDSLGVLDELSVVRARLEGVMAGAMAGSRTADQLERLREQTERMAEALDDGPRFREADSVYHEIVMELSGNRLVESIARILFDQARESSRFLGAEPAGHFELTLREHETILAAIGAQQVEEAERLMNQHIIDAWARRRLPTRRG